MAICLIIWKVYQKCCAKDDTKSEDNKNLETMENKIKTIETLEAKIKILDYNVDDFDLLNQKQNKEIHKKANIELFELLEDKVKTQKQMSELEKEKIKEDLNTYKQNSSREIRHLNNELNLEINQLKLDLANLKK